MSKTGILFSQQWALDGNKMEKVSYLERPKKKKKTKHKGFFFFLVIYIYLFYPSAISPAALSGDYIFGVYEY